MSQPILHLLKINPISPLLIFRGSCIHLKIKESNFPPIESSKSKSQKSIPQSNELEEKREGDGKTFDWFRFDQVYTRRGDPIVTTR